MPKIICPFHEDNRPSAELYGTHAFCFVCWKRFAPDAAGIPAEEVDKKVKPSEDIEAGLDRILALPEKPIRGLWFKADARGYYLIWPNAPYYKCRLFSNEGPRYLCPRGTSQPLFILENAGKNGLVIIEGEINALSVAEIAGKYGFSVVSPGSAGNFHSRADELREIIREYPEVFCWVDKDSPGIQALWQVARLCAETDKPLSYMTLEVDANEILCKAGTDGIEERLMPFLSKSF